jgi:hypothetical protein
MGAIINMKIKALLIISLVPMAVLLTICHATAEPANISENYPWEKFSANFGAFILAVDTGIRIGSGTGLDIDLEEFLDLETSTIVFRTDALWRFTKNRRHRLDFTWFSLNRDGSRQIDEDITFKDKNGDTITIEAGENVKSNFDLDIFEMDYRYSFIQDDRLDLAAGIGLYFMPINYSIQASGAVEKNGSEKFAAPLPALGLRLDIAITPQWFIRNSAQVFYAEYDEFKGSLLEFRAAVEYNPWQHVGLGLGFDSLAIHLEADGEDWPGADFEGDVDFKYMGLQLYLRLFF